MATSKCNDCKASVLRSELKFYHSSSYMSFSAAVDNQKRPILVLLDVKAWRYLCGKCQKKEENGRALLKGSGGDVIVVGSPKWKAFLQKYSDVASVHGLGYSKDKLKQHSAFKNAPNNFTYGATKHFDVIGLFKMASANDKAADSGNQQLQCESNTTNNSSTSELSDTTNSSTLEQAKVYDTSGKSYKKTEFDAVLDWMKANPYEAIMKKETFFEEQGLSEYMSNLKWPKRKPSSYDSMLTRVMNQGEKHKWFKEDAKLYKKFTDILDRIDEVQKKKYNMDSSAKSSVAAARNGLFAKDHRESPKKAKGNANNGGVNPIIGKTLKQRGQEKQDKKYFQNQRLKAMVSQNETLKQIGNNMQFMNMQSEDYWGDLILFVSMDYGKNESTTKKIMETLAANKVKFCALWSACLRRSLSTEEKIKILDKQLKVNMPNASD